MLRVGLVEHVVGGGVKGGYVFIGESEDRVARLTLIVFTSSNKNVRTLSVVGLPGDGDT